MTGDLNDKEWIAACEALVRGAAPALHQADIHLVALDIQRLLPGLTPGAAADRYFGPGALQ